MTDKTEVYKRYRKLKGMIESLEGIKGAYPAISEINTLLFDAKDELKGLLFDEYEKAQEATSQPQGCDIKDWVVSTQPPKKRKASEASYEIRIENQTEGPDAQDQPRP